MLACFASTGDLRHQNVGTAGCADAAKALHACMAKPRNVRAARVPSVSERTEATGESWVFRGVVGVGVVGTADFNPRSTTFLAKSSRPTSRPCITCTASIWNKIYGVGGGRRHGGDETAATRESDANASAGIRSFGIAGSLASPGGLFTNHLLSGCVLPTDSLQR